MNKEDEQYVLGVWRGRGGRQWWAGRRFYGCMQKKVRSESGWVWVWVSRGFCCAETLKTGLVAIGQSTCPETFLVFGTGGSAGLELSELFIGLSSLGDLSLRHETVRNRRQTEIKIVTCTIQKNSHCCIDYIHYYRDRGFTTVLVRVQSKYELQRPWNNKFPPLCLEYSEPGT